MIADVIAGLSFFLLLGFLHGVMHTLWHEPHKKCDEGNRVVERRHE